MRRRAKATQCAPVGLEIPLSGRKRNTKARHTAFRPHWNDCTLKTGVLMGEQFTDYRYTADAIDDLARLYNSFKVPAGLERFTFYKSQLPQAERTIKRAIEEYLNGVYAHKGMQLANMWEETDTEVPCFAAMYEINNPPASYTALYLRDAMAWQQKDELIYNLLFKGMEILSWRTGFNDWNFMSVTDRVHDQITNLQEELETIEKIKARSEDDEKRRSDVISQIEAMKAELREEEEIVFGRPHVAKAAQYKSWIKQLDKKKYPDLYKWACLIWKFYVKKINMDDWIPRDPETMFITPGHYYYIAIRPGYLADALEEEIDMMAQEASYELFHIDYYSPHKAERSAVIDWEQAIKTFFRFDPESLSFTQPGIPLVDKL
jgi:hypothetical protein